MKKSLAICLLFFVQATLATDWHSLEGIYAITPTHYLDPADNEVKDSHLRVQLTGQSAKALYLAMQTKPVVDDCTGGLAKNIEQMQCLFFEKTAKYDCHFSIDIEKQVIDYGVVC